MTLRAYLTGFILSLLLTTAAFGLVSMHLDTGHVSPSHEVLYPLLAVLALIQLVVQLTYFLHVKDSPAWNRFILVLALMVAAFIVGGTLWIMGNLQAQHALFEGEPTPQTQID